MEQLIIIGAGGYAKSVLDSIDYYNYRLKGFLDSYSDKTEHIGYPIIAKKLDDISDKEKYFYFIAVGNSEHRKVWYDRLRELNLRMINVVDKTAIISPQAKIGTGCFFGKYSVINAGSTVHDNCLVNTKALVEHGCEIAPHVNISTNAVINGDVKVGTGSFIGSCSVILGQLQVGEWSTVGAGAVVTKSVPSGVTVAGVPAKIINQKTTFG